MKLIGICGDIGSGKDTVANHLMAEHGFDSFSFANALKEWAFTLVGPLGVERRHIFGGSPETKQADNAELLHMLPSRPDADGGAWTGRALLEYLGTEVGRSIHPDIWVRHMIAYVQRNQGRPIDTELRLVIPDVRFPNEFDAIRRLGGEIWRTVLDVKHSPSCPVIVSSWREACDCGAIQATGHASDLEWRTMYYHRLLTASKPGVDLLQSLATMGFQSMQAGDQS